MHTSTSPVRERTSTPTPSGYRCNARSTLALLPAIPPGITVVSESGFAVADDVRRIVAAGAHAVLVGEGLVRAADTGAKVRELALR